MLLHVLVERHGFEHHFLMYAAGVEEMQFAVLPPDSETYMSDVEAFLVGRDGDDVAVMYVGKHGLALPYRFLGNVANGGTRGASFHFGYEAPLLHVLL